MDVKLDQMRKEAGNQQRKLEQLIQRLSGSLHSSKLQETEQKASQIIKTWTRSWFIWSNRIFCILHKLAGNIGNALRDEKLTPGTTHHLVCQIIEISFTTYLVSVRLLANSVADGVHLWLTLKNW